MTFNWFRRHAFLVRRLEETSAALAVSDRRAQKLGEELKRERRNFRCARELIEQRDEQYKALAAQCRNAETERDLWRRFYDKSMPPMDAF